MTLVNAIAQPRRRRPRPATTPGAATRSSGSPSRRPEPHNFDVLPDVRSARPMRDIREAIAHRTGRAEERPARESQPVA